MNIVKRLILFGLLGGLLATNTGCGLFQAIFCYRPCATRGDCGEGVCGNPCNEGCGPACGPRRPLYPARPMRASGDCDCGCGDVIGRPCRRAACASCGACDEPCGDSCDCGGCGTCGRPWHRGPLSCVFALFTPCSWWGGGCGQRYWGDFYSDPPDCWDPCDGYGNYSGGGHSAGVYGDGISGSGVSTGGGGGCRNCGAANRGAGAVYDNYSGGPSRGESIPAGEIVSQRERTVRTSARPTTQPHKAARPQQYSNNG
jgi:hypothetical protein